MGILTKQQKPTSSAPRRHLSEADAPFSSTQQGVLALLFGNPDRTFFATEIIDRVSKGSGGVQRELKKQSESGLVVVSRIGNQKHYQANPESPIYDELCSLIRKTVGFAGPLRDALSAAEEDISLALVYGSVAKREARATSDVDLLLVSDALTLEGVYRLLVPAEEILRRTINPTLYTPDEFQRRRRDEQPFLKRVLTGETIVLIGSLADE